MWISHASPCVPVTPNPCIPILIDHALTKLLQLTFISVTTAITLVL